MIRETFHSVCHLVQRLCGALNHYAGAIEETGITVEEWAKQFRQEEELKAKSKRLQLESELKLLTSDR